MVTRHRLWRRRLAVPRRTAHDLWRSARTPAAAVRQDADLQTTRNRRLQRYPDPKSGDALALITERKIRRSIYRSVAALRADIAFFIERHNRDPKPFRWTKSPDDILQSIERFCLYNARVIA